MKKHTASSGQGKGDWYRKVNRRKYEENYEKFNGKKCLNCRGKGSIYNWDLDIDEICENCNGEGKIFINIREK